MPTTSFHSRRSQPVPHHCPRHLPACTISHMEKSWSSAPFSHSLRRSDNARFLLHPHMYTVQNPATHLQPLQPFRWSYRAPSPSSSRNPHIWNNPQHPPLWPPVPLPDSSTESHHFPAVPVHLNMYTNERLCLVPPANTQSHQNLLYGFPWTHS